tara:strand:+ start:5720 stop:5986 length:267 start_codon:yes stop_codon:yes gene_type:complete
MSVMILAARLTERLQASQGSELVVPTSELGDFLVAAERQLEEMVKQIKGKEREVAVLTDRVEAQRGSIQRLQSQVSSLETKPPSRVSK